jgi:hypothetical protein
MHPAGRWLVFLSAAIAVVLSVVLAPGTASAAAVPAGNGVGAHHPGMIFTVGADQHVPAGEGRGEAAPRADLAAGACVAAEDTGATAGDEVPAFSRSAYGRVPGAARGQVLGENPTCVYCGENPANQVDHINSLRQDWESGGWSDEPAVRTARVNDPGNLTGACASCNASKGASPIGTGPGEWWPPGWPLGEWWPFGGP